MSITELTNILDKYGINGLLIIASILIIITMIKNNTFSSFFNKFGENLANKLSKTNNKSKSIKISDINKHDIFNYIDIWVNSNIPTLMFATPFKTAVFRKYLIIYLQTYKNDFLEYIKESGYEKMDSQSLWCSVFKLLNNIVENYETEMRKDGIPELVINKMKKINNENINLTINMICEICNSDFYSSENNYLKIYSILNILQSILNNTILHSSSVCNSINGSLKGLTFEGITE